MTGKHEREPDWNIHVAIIGNTEQGVICDHGVHTGTWNEKKGSWLIAHLFSLEKNKSGIQILSMMSGWIVMTEMQPF